MTIGAWVCCWDETHAVSSFQHLAFVAERDVFDVDEYFVAALAVAHLPAGVAGAGQGRQEPNARMVFGGTSNDVEDPHRPRSPAPESGVRRVTTVVHVGHLQWATEEAVVEFALKRLPGVQRVEANAVAQTATVTYDSRAPSVAGLRQWIEDYRQRRPAP